MFGSLDGFTPLNAGCDKRVNQDNCKRYDISTLDAVKRISFLMVLFLLFFDSPLHAASSMSMELAFRGKGWKTMDSIFNDANKKTKKGENSLSSRDISLYINALWMQGRYREGVKILESARPEYPEAVEPYAKMLLVLGLERIGRKKDALEEGRKLWSRAPSSLQYYLSYGLGRLTRDLSMPKESLGWFRKMLALAPDEKLRLNALKQIVSVRADENDAALLLMESPLDEKALAICQEVPKGKNPKVDYALGMHFYTSRKYSEAIPRFELVSNDLSLGEAARYYYAFSLSRNGDPDTALYVWIRIAREGLDFPQRALQRIVATTNESKKPQTLRVMREIADSRKDNPDLVADALLGMVRLGDKKTADAAESELFEKYPSSNQCATARWEKGWRAWRAKKYEAAALEWSRGYSKEIKNVELASRLLYWQSKALGMAGEKREKIERIKSELLTLYPGEYYAFLVSPDGGIVNNTPVPDRYIEKGILESWGFITYARLENARTYSDTSPPVSFYTGIRLALWQNDFASAVHDFSLLQQKMTKNERASSELLRRAHPRAFGADVLSASRKTGIEPAIIWGIMRQESRYDPHATGTSGEYGLMQLMPGTANEETRKLKLTPGSYKKIPDNILIGANYLAGLLLRFKELPKALSAYNAGGAPTKRWDQESADDMAEWVENIGYPQTRNYVKTVLRNIEVYRVLYYKK